MRTSILLTLTLAPAALIAQAPAATQAPAPAAAQAPAPAAAPAPAPLTFSQRFRGGQAGINQLVKDFQPEEALAKAEALLPPTRPPFDASGVIAGRRCSIQFSDLARTYHLAGKCAVSAGHWEQGRDYFLKAQEVAQVNLDQTTAIVTPTIESWKEPVAKAKKALADGAARRAELKAKTTPLTAQEDVELKNFAIHEQNVVNGEKYMKDLAQDITITRTELASFGPMIESLNKSIQAEKEEMDKDIAGKDFKGDRAKFLTALLNAKSLEARPTKAEKVNFLFRLKAHCAGTPQAEKVQAVIDRVRHDEDPFPAPPPPAKKSKKKKAA